MFKFRQRHQMAAVNWVVNDSDSATKCQQSDGGAACWTNPKTKRKPRLAINLWLNQAQTWQGYVNLSKARASASQYYVRTLRDGPLHTFHKRYCQPNCVKQNPSWEANSCSASHEIPKVLYNPEVHYGVQMNRMNPLSASSIQSSHPT